MPSSKAFRIDQCPDWHWISSESANWWEEVKRQEYHCIPICRTQSRKGLHGLVASFDKSVHVPILILPPSFKPKHCILPIHQSNCKSAPTTCCIYCIIRRSSMTLREYFVKPQSLLYASYYCPNWMLFCTFFQTNHHYNLPNFKQL